MDETGPLPDPVEIHSWVVASRRYASALLEWLPWAAPAGCNARIRAEEAALRSLDAAQAALASRLLPEAALRASSAHAWAVSASSWSAAAWASGRGSDPGTDPGGSSGGPAAETRRASEQAALSAAGMGVRFDRIALSLQGLVSPGQPLPPSRPSESARVALSR